MRRRLPLVDERGVATVMVALSMPFIFLFCVIAVDVANWFVHKRHLQTQADAAALAGAGKFVYPSCDNTLITNTALQYSGKGDGISPTYNPPSNVSTPDLRLHAQINKKNFFGQTKPNEADLPETPCNAKFLDVKMTEDNVPWFWGTGLVPFINAEARVALLPATEFEGVLPIGVPEPAPKTVRAFVVDEATGAEIPGASVVLTEGGAVSGVQMFSNSTPLTFSLPPGTSSNLGVRIALSGSGSTQCETPPVPLVNCYDSVATTQGLSYIRTWEDPAPRTAGQPPAIGSVNVTPNTCDNASFTSSAAACTMDVVAKVKWNPDITATGIAAGDASLIARFNGADHTMTYDAALATWTAANITIPTGTIAPRSVTIDWKQFVGTVGTDTCKPGGGNKCDGSFGVVQRTFWNNPEDQGSRAGPIARLEVLDSSSTQLVSDLERCATCTASLLFDVGIKGSLKVAAPSDPPVSLRVSGNQTQSLQCDPDEGGSSGLITMLSEGCPFRYKVNAGETCGQKSALWATPEPWPCVAIRTGDPPNATPEGLNRRILCNPRVDGPTATANCTPSGGASVCTHPNKWPNYAPDDPRIVDVFLTPYGTFSGTGNNETVPVIGVASFYVTGYTGQGGISTPCAAVTGADADDYSINPPPAGNISGHFIVTVTPNPNGGSTGPGNTLCDVTEIGKCVAVLVK